MTPDIEDLLKRSRDTLAEFLTIELDCAFTFVQLAKDRQRTKERAESLKRNAQKAAATVRRLRAGLDSAVRGRIEDRLADLERLISEL